LKIVRKESERVADSEISKRKAGALQKGEGTPKIKKNKNKHTYLW
jgi:hypothetical protein